MSKRHPSGRPIHRDNCRAWKHGPYVENGHRNWRLNPPHHPRITAATDLHSVGFIDWRSEQEIHRLGFEDSAVRKK